MAYQDRWIVRLDSFRKALAALQRVVAVGGERPLNEFEKDSLVKRFEYTYEMAWKTMKDYCAFQSIDVGGSRDTVRAAFQLGIIDNAQAWMDMIDSRNMVAHTYDMEKAAEIADSIVYDYYPLMTELAATLEERRKSYG